MKTRWLLCGILSGLTILPLTTSVAQDADTPPVTNGAPVADTAKPAVEPSLTDKLKLSRLSPSARDVIKMSEAGMDESLLKSYVENSSAVYSLNSDDVIFLHERGIPSNVITAMLQRSAKVRDQVAATTPPPMPPTPPAAPVYQQVQQPAPTYVIQQAPPAPAPAPIIVPGPSYAYNQPSSVIYIGSGYSGYCAPRYSRSYFDFHYSSGWNSPFYYGGHGGGFGYRHCR